MRCLCITAAVLVCAALGGGRAGSVEIVGHRGASHDAPENTIAAFELAFERGADAVECDVHLTKDGRLVVIHDEDTQRTAGRRLVVAESTLEQLRGLDVGAFKGESHRGQRIPLLEEVVRLVPEGRGLLVEVKSGTETVKPLHELLQRTGVGRRIVVMSFDLDVATAIKNLEPSRVVLWLVKAEKGLVGLRKPISEKVIGIAKGRGLDGLGLDVRGTSLELARKVKRAGLVLYVWTVDDPARAKRMIDAGADGIITNRPGWLRKKLKL